MSIKKWEYKTLEAGQYYTRGVRNSTTHDGDSFEKDLNKLGEQGWEFVGRGMNNGEIHNHLVFKREKK
ncbi:DUF4177 domain-containing protein [SAR86 cluster bacterium]|nr:DUF4177 domain-containing protein [SAR86 cluster bacterium]